MFKFLTYSGMLEKKRRENLQQTKKDDVIALGVHNFDVFYREQLMKDAKKPPREVKPEEYKPKRGLELLESQRAVFKSTPEREADYFREFEIYKENKSKCPEHSLLMHYL